jgi:hypothetical protein
MEMMLFQAAHAQSKFPMKRRNMKKMLQLMWPRQQPLQQLKYLKLLSYPQQPPEINLNAKGLSSLELIKFLSLLL